MASVYGDRWKIVGDLGKGGQATVFRCIDLAGEHPGELALKRVINPKRHERFRNEIEAIKRLAHPNIIQLLDHSALDAADTDEKQFLVMPIAEGGNLSKRVGIYKDSLDGVLLVAKNVAAALKHAHEVDVIHRDVKPDNVLFSCNDHSPWLADFGICLLKDLPRATETGEVVGPRAFMAPELEHGGRLDVSPAADVYSLGKLIFFMISGGVVLPREEINRTPYSDIFLKGGRYQLLQLMLLRMITAKENRIETMEEVISEIDKVERWETTAKSGVLTELAASSLEKMVARKIEEKTKAADEEEKRRLREEELREVIGSYSEWIESQMGFLRDAIYRNGIIEAGYHLLGQQDRERLAITAKDNITYTTGASLHACEIRLATGSVFRVQLIQLHRSTRGERPHADILFLPRYGRHIQPGRPTKGSMQFFPMPQEGKTIGKRPPPRQIQRNREPEIEILSQPFSAEQWPGICENIKELLAKAFEQFVSITARGRF